MESTSKRQRPSSTPPRESAVAAQAQGPGPGVQVDADDLQVRSWRWQGPDQFTPLGDRRDLPPLPLPCLPGQRRRVVLVRHGQSTWNARNRVQGSSDFSVLTEAGARQAAAAAELLADWRFDALFHSPLKRAAQTARVVWGAREGPRHNLPSLREVDLYSFQGLDKAQGRTSHAEAFEAWQQRPHEFVLDGRAPVRELWHRASIAWGQILGHPDFTSQALVVAHNAVNQALVCTALGLPPSVFRRLTQTNAAYTVLDFHWPCAGESSSGVQGGATGGDAASAGGDGSLTAPAGRPVVTVERLNQFPEAPLRRDRLGRSAVDRLILVTGPAGSPEVTAALQLLAASGVSAAPLVAVGSAAEQAADVATALQATLRTLRPAEGRAVLAVAAPAACQQLLDRCLATRSGGEGEGEASAAAAPLMSSTSGTLGSSTGGTLSVGSAFSMEEGGITIVNYNRGAEAVHEGVLLCANLDPSKAQLG